MIHQQLTKDQRGESLMQSLRSRGGKAISRKEFAASRTGYFSSQGPQNLETMTCARMATTRTCVYHVNNEDAGKSHAITGECLATMIYECFVHQVTTIGDANKMAYQRQGQQLNFSYCMSAFHFGLTELSWRRIRSWRRMLQEMLHEMWMWESSKLHPIWIWSIWRNSLVRRLMRKRAPGRRLWTLVIAVLWHFLEFGSFHVQRRERRQLPWFLCVWESEFFQSKWATSLFDKWRSSFSSSSSSSFFFFEIGILIRTALLWWSRLRPPTKTRRVSRVMLEGRNEQTRGRQIRRRGKQRERLKPALEVYLSQEKITSLIIYWVLSIRIDDGFHWRQLVLCRLSYAESEMSWLCTDDEVWWESLWSQLTVFSLLFLLLFWMACQLDSSIVVKFRACRFLSHQMNWLVFVGSL